jgi:hypothetical protein
LFENRNLTGIPGPKKEEIKITIKPFIHTLYFSSTMYAMIKNEVEMDSGTTTNKQMKSVYGFGMETSMKNTYAWHSGVSDLGSAQRPAILS